MSAVTYIRQAFGYKVLVPALLLAKRVYQPLDRETDAKTIMVNIGGGTFIKRHWKNLDYSSDHYPYKLSVLDLNFDLTSGEPFPFEDGTVTHFFSSHTLEHIPQKFCDHIFKEFHRCLKPSGAVRLTMPDFDQIYDGYMAGQTGFWGKNRASSPEHALCGAVATDLRPRAEELAPTFRDKSQSLTKQEFADYVTDLVSLESQFANFSNHCNWWNHEKLHASFLAAGFGDIYESEALNSRFAEMRDAGSFLGIERFARMPGLRGFDFAHVDQSLFIEAVK
jgi:hypothetical protein